MGSATPPPRAKTPQINRFCQNFKKGSGVFGASHGGAKESVSRSDKASQSSPRGAKITWTVTILLFCQLMPLTATVSKFEHLVIWHGTLLKCN